MGKVKSLLRLCECTGCAYVLKFFLHIITKHAYSNTIRILPPKYENFQIKNSDIFLISAQNIDCRYWLELPR